MTRTSPDSTAKGFLEGCLSDFSSWSPTGGKKTLPDGGHEADLEAHIARNQARWGPNIIVDGLRSVLWDHVRPRTLTEVDMIAVSSRFW